MPESQSGASLTMKNSQQQLDPLHGGVWKPQWLGKTLRAVVAVAMAVIVTLIPNPAPSQDIEVLLPEKECQVKYALLYSFGLFTAWPPQAFDPPDTGPFVIGVLGAKPFPEYLNRIAQTKKVQNRPIVIRRFQSPDEVAGCHLLYVTNAINPEAEQAVTRKLANQPVLLVSERPPEAGNSGATIQFLIEQGAVKFVLNTDSAKTHQLQIDPRLLKLAKRPNSEAPK
jgi:YfiR/HmsC-like